MRSLHGPWLSAEDVSLLPDGQWIEVVEPDNTISRTGVVRQVLCYNEKQTRVVIHRFASDGMGDSEKYELILSGVGKEDGRRQVRTVTRWRSQ